MMTKNKNKKSSMNMLCKMSIIPVALVAMYLFACNSNSNNDSSQTSDEVFLFAEVGEKPTFNGKDAETGFREYIKENTNYPVAAQENGITGRVYVEFTIDKDGSVTDVELLRGADPLLDAEALRVIKSSPKWTPGKHGGEAVSVKYQFPIYFHLNN